MSRSRVESYRDLDVWKRGMRLVTEIYQLTSAFPDDEKYGLVAQLRRAAISIPSNIAEGWGRKRLVTTSIIYESHDHQFLRLRLKF